MAKLDYVRRHVEIQGFLGLSDAKLAELAPWFRFTPIANFVFISLGVALASPVLLWTASLLMAAGAIARAHPFDLLYNHAVRHLVRKSKLPPSPDRRRFVFAIAAAWLTGTAFAFYSGNTTVGYVLGGMIAVMIIPLATAYVCLVSEPMELLLGPATPYHDE